MIFLYLSSFYLFYFGAVAIYAVFMPKIIYNIGYSAFEIGIIFALPLFMRFAVPFLFLKHIKLDGTIFKFALALLVLSSSMLYITINNFYLLSFNSALLGVAISIVLPYIDVIALKEIGKEKYGKTRLFGSIGFVIITIIIAKLLGSSYDIAIHFYLILNTLTAIFAILLLKYDFEIVEEKRDEKPFSFIKHWQLWVSLFLMQLSFGAFYNFFTIYETSFGVSLEMVSYLWTFGVVCEILMLYFQAPLLKNNLLLVIKISILLTALRWLLLYLYPNSLNIAFLSQSFHAFSFALFNSAVIVYLYTIYENKKLAQQFMYGIAYGLGGFFGSLIAGALYGENIFLYSSIISLISFLILYIKPKTKALN